MPSSIADEPRSTVGVSIAHGMFGRTVRICEELTPPSCVCLSRKLSLIFPTVFTSSRSRSTLARRCLRPRRSDGRCQPQSERRTGRNSHRSVDGSAPRFSSWWQPAETNLDSPYTVASSTQQQRDDARARASSTIGALRLVEACETAHGHRCRIILMSTIPDLASNQARRAGYTISRKAGCCSGRPNFVTVRQSAHFSQTEASLSDAT